MNLNFNRKIISLLLMLCVACVCVGVVSANDIACNDGFTAKGGDVFATVHGSGSTGYHWKVTDSEGFKLVSDTIYPSNTNMIGANYLEKFHFQKLFSAKNYYIKLTEFDPCKCC